MTDHQGQNFLSGSSSEGVRKLAAIMFTDMKDFSKKMQANETLMLRILEEHNRIMHQTVQRYRGTVIKTIGDAFLVSFESVVDAVSCAMEVQANFQEYNRDKSSSEKIIVRIGVHLGDVIVKGNDVFGDGVNIASRVQSTAEPGGLNITESVYQQVKNKLDVHVVKLGAPQLKGIKEAIKVYQVILMPETKRRGKFATNLYVMKTLLKRRRSRRILGTSLLVAIVGAWIWLTYFSVPTIKSIAVLPFENLGSAVPEYVVDGLSEEIIAQLSKIPDILVISKASSFSFRNSKLDDRNIAEQLGVQLLLKGNIRHILGQVRVYAYLIEPISGERAWEEDYSLSQHELFYLQHQIPRHIAERFKLQFAAKFVQSSPEVYDLYSRGLFERAKLIRENNFAAVGYFSEAMNKDSHFVPAIIGLAKSYYLNYEWGWDKSEQNLLLAEQSCRKVLRLDTTNAEATAIMGRIEINKGNRETGIQLLHKALQYDARNETALTWLGREYLFNLNDPPTGIALLQRAFESDPTNFVLAGNIGIGYGMLKNYHSAIETFRQAMRLNPQNDYPQRNLAIAFEKLGLYDSSLFYYSKAVEKNPIRAENYLYWGELLLSLNKNAQAESVLTAGRRHTSGDYRILYALGVAYSRLGNQFEADRVWREGLGTAQSNWEQQPSSEPLSYIALMNARLRSEKSALKAVQLALQHDSTDSEVVFNTARVYAILGKRKEMLFFYKKARLMNPEYDLDYLTTALDFENFRNDTELRAIAQKK